MLKSCDRELPPSAVSAERRPDVTRRPCAKHRPRAKHRPYHEHRSSANHHPFTEPADMPLMKKRWKTRNRIRTGNEPKTLIAIIWFHSNACCPISN